MKKILLVTALVLAIGLSASAQDGFFRGGYDDSGDRGTGAGISATTPLLPGYGVGANHDDQPGTAPLGGGLLVLTVLGAGYAFSRRKK